MSAASNKAALRQRVRDIATGALGANFDDEQKFATADFLSRFIPALKDSFDRQGRSHLWEARNLDNFDNIDTTANFLFNHGVRATDQKEAS